MIESARLLKVAPSSLSSAGQQQLRLSGGPELRLCQQELRRRCLDVLKVTPEEFAVSVRTDVGAGHHHRKLGGERVGVVIAAHSCLLKLETTHIFTNRGLLVKVFFMNALYDLWSIKKGCYLGGGRN